ncbi:hypothetical protein [Azohydromonas australica]|uniref:hypothetical protein n=1 Tax=Azohydromonas australica TaxID=364039 RepID=UPI0004195CD4|nr:hypothetical protein [Azohydromonas australica]
MLRVLLWLSGCQGARSRCVSAGLTNATKVLTEQEHKALGLDGRAQQQYGYAALLVQVLAT